MEAIAAQPRDKPWISNWTEFRMMVFNKAISVASKRRGHLQLLTVVSMIFIALLLRINSGLLRDLWEDEIIAATHAEQPFWRLPVTVMRFDVHPFLYFLQLHAWALFGDSDVWLRLNSIFWNFSAIGSIFLVARHLYGAQIAWIAASLFALSPPVVWMAQELRPYSWLYCLLIWTFYFIELPYRTGDDRFIYKIATFSLCAGIIHSHAIGFFAVFLLGLYALGWAIEVGVTRRAIVSWGVLFGLCALTAALPIAVDLLRDANLGASRGLLADLSDWIPRLLLPRGNAFVAIVLASLIYLGVIVLGIAMHETRLITLIFLLAPIVLASMLNTADMHFFKLNVFGTFIMPFFIIVLVRILVRMPGSRGWAGAVALGLIFTGFSVLFFLNRMPTTGFRAASQLIQAEARTGDIVYTPQQSMFWGMARYMGTDQRAWQLQIAPTLTDQWQHMYDRLGPWFVSSFDLEPRTQTLVTRSGLPLLVGNESINAIQKSHRVWMVTYKREDLPIDFPPNQIGTLKPTFTKSVGFLHVQLYE